MARKAEPNATAQMIEDLWDKLNEKYDNDYFEILAEKDMKVIFNTENIILVMALVSMKLMALLLRFVVQVVIGKLLYTLLCMLKKAVRS